jgi:hypothetical protein
MRNYGTVFRHRIPNWPSMLQNNVLLLPVIDNISNRVCNEYGMCKKTDYVMYTNTSKFGNTTTEKFEKTVITTNWEKPSLIKTNVFQD